MFEVGCLLAKACESFGACLSRSRALSARRRRREADVVRARAQCPSRCSTRPSRSRTSSGRRSATRSGLRIPRCPWNTTLIVLLDAFRLGQARLLHYFAPSATPDVSSVEETEALKDDYCGIHLDHSLLTALCPSPLPAGRDPLLPLDRGSRSAPAPATHRLGPVPVPPDRRLARGPPARGQGALRRQRALHRPARGRRPGQGVDPGQLPRVPDGRGAPALHRSVPTPSFSCARPSRADPLGPRCCRRPPAQGDAALRPGRLGPVARRRRRRQGHRHARDVCLFPPARRPRRRRRERQDVWRILQGGHRACLPPSGRSSCLALRSS